MVQKIYLCRHAQYVKSDNPVKPSTRQDLTEDGKRQSGELGEYIRRFVEPESAIFVTSTLERSLKTAEIVAKSMGTRLKKGNHYAVNELGETDIKDYVRDYVKAGDVKSIADYPRSYLSKLPTSRTVANRISGHLIKLGDKYPDKSLIAILHGIINAAFLHHADNKRKSWLNYRMDYCELWELERKGSNIVPLTHRFRPLDLAF